MCNEQWLLSYLMLGDLVKLSAAIKDNLDVEKHRVFQGPVFVSFLTMLLSLAQSRDRNHTNYMNG